MKALKEMKDGAAVAVRDEKEGGYETGEAMSCDYCKVIGFFQNGPRVSGAVAAIEKRFKLTVVRKNGEPGIAGHVGDDPERDGDFEGTVCSPCYNRKPWKKSAPAKKEKKRKKGVIDNTNREAWLRDAYALLRRELLPEAPETVAVTWGFPSKGATSRKRTIGQCFMGKSVQGDVEGGRVILVSPTLSDPAQIIDVLLHEMVHAALPVGTGHRKAFSQLAKRVGLEKPWTATTASKELKAKIDGWLKSELRPWPGGHLVVVPKEKGRQLKASCECGRILRMAKATFEAGPLLCGNCDSAFEMS